MFLGSSFLYYRRQDKKWMATLPIRIPLAAIGLLILFLYPYPKGLLICLIAAVGITITEIGTLTDQPYCILDDRRIAVKRHFRVTHSFSWNELTAMGSIDSAEKGKLFFLCAVSPKKMKHFLNTHEKDKVQIATAYGYDPGALSEEELFRTMVTAYMWRKASIGDLNTFPRRVLPGVRNSSPGDFQTLYGR